MYTQVKKRLLKLDAEKEHLFESKCNLESLAGILWGRNIKTIKNYFYNGALFSINIWSNHS